MFIVTLIDVQNLINDINKLSIEDNISRMAIFADKIKYIN